MPKRKPQTEVNEPAVRTYSSNPIFKYDDKFYFWDETWSWCYGPFDFEENARHLLELYIKYLDSADEGTAKSWKHSENVASNVRWRTF